MEKWHIIPENDVEDHIESLRCECNPKVINEREGQIIVHNAYDRREIFEINDERNN